MIHALLSYIVLIEIIVFIAITSKRILCIDLSEYADYILSYYNIVGAKITARKYSPRTIR